MYSANYADCQESSLEALKTSFARLVRQEFFPIYRPRHSTFEIRGSSQAASPDRRNDQLRSHLSSIATKLVVTDPSHVYVIDLTSSVPVVEYTIRVEVRPDVVEIADSGATLATVSNGNFITVYSLQAGRHTVLTTLEGSQTVTTVALTPDGLTLAAAGESGTALFSLDERQSFGPRHIIDADHVQQLRFAKGTVICGIRRLPNGSSHFIGRSVHSPGATSSATADDLSRAWMIDPLDRLDFEYFQCILQDDSVRHESSYVGLRAFHDILPRTYSESVRNHHLDATEIDRSRALLFSPNASLGLSSMNSGDKSIRMTRSSTIISHDDAQARIAADDGDIRKRFVDVFWNEYRQSCRSIEVSSPITELDWVTESNLETPGRHAFGQRLVTLNFPISDDSINTTNTTGRAPSLTFLDFDSYVEVQEESKRILNLEHAKIEGEHIEDPTENLHVLDTSLPSSSSSLTRGSHAGHPSIASDYKDSSADARQPGSLLPSQVSDKSEPDLSSPPVQPVASESIPSNVAYASISDHDLSEGARTDESLSQTKPDAQTSIDGVPYHLSNNIKSHQTTGRLNPLVTASTPDLLQTQTMYDSTTRPRAQNRVRSAFGAARNSVVMSGQQLRRVFSGPLEVPSSEQPQTKHAPPMPAPMVARTFRNRPQSVALDAIPSDLDGQPRRRSLLPRPNSFHAGTILSSTALPKTKGNPRSISQPLDRPRTPPSQTGRLEKYPPESPNLPSPSQVLSLHRRQASGSVSSVHIRTRSLSGSNDPFAVASHADGIEVSSAPRAALGAYRRNTGTPPVSPWQSTAMLTRGESGPTANRRYSMPLQTMNGMGNVARNSDRNVTLNANGRTVSAPLLSKPNNASDPTTTNGNGLIVPRARGESVTKADQAPPSRLQEHSLPATPNMPSVSRITDETENQASNDDKPLPPIPSTKSGGLKPRKTRKSGRLSTIQSVASLMGSARSSSPNKTQPGQETRPQTTSGAAERDKLDSTTQRKSAFLAGGSISGSGAPASKEGSAGKKESIWGKWRKRVMQNLAGV